MKEFSTFVDLLRFRAWKHPNQVVFSFLAEGETEQGSFTWGELDRAARTVAASLQESGVVPGERAVLLYPAGLEFLAAFFGALYAGVVAVPAYPPRRNRLEQRLPAMVADCRPSAVLTTHAVAERSSELLAGAAFGEARWLATDQLDSAAAEVWRAPGLLPETLAFLQYTSGSTGAPKGVRVLHRNLLHNEEMIGRAFGQSERSVVVGWLPLYHDMGLIGNVLQPIHAGGRAVLMSPMAFLQRPARWLEAIHRYRGTTSGGPNFAYELCIERVSDEVLAQLDLSCWEVAFNGAEPVREHTLRRFAERFAACGFRPEALYPCYGMAETTLFVTGGTHVAPPVVRSFSKAALERGLAEPHDGREAPDSEDERSLVSSGHSWMGQEVVIVDPETRRRCGERRVGEIWVHGPSVADGYWNKEELSMESFGARLAEEPDAGPYLRTGDLGFLHNDELFVTGREKDLIILRGRNLYPQDLELTVEGSHGALRSGCTAAFAIDDGIEERLAVAVEVDRRAMRRLTDEGAIEAVVEAVRQAVAEVHQARVHTVVLLRAGTLPKTSSGKVRRRRCRELLLADQLDLVGRSHLDAPLEAQSKPTVQTADPLSGAPPSPARILASDPAQRRELLTRHCLHAVALSLPGAVEGLDPHKPLTALGLDSLAAMELGHRLEKEFGTTPDVATLLEGASLDELVDHLLQHLEASPDAPRSPPHHAAFADQPAEGDHPLAHGQRALWFLQTLAPESAAYNIAVATELRGTLDEGALRRTFRRLAGRHPMLRTRFPAVQGEPVQRVLPAARETSFSFQAEDAVEWSAERVEEFLCEQAHLPFNLEDGPLLRIALLRRAPHEHLMLLVIHHIVADLWSLALVADELDILYREEVGRASGPPPAESMLAPLESHYPAWVRAEQQRLTGEDGERLAAFWSEQLGGDLPQLDLLTDRPRPPVQTWRGASVQTVLGEDLSRQVFALAHDTGATLYTTLLTAFQVLLHRTTSQDDLLVGSPTAGRNLATANLVGYFIHPVVLRGDLRGDPTSREVLRRLRSTVLDAQRHRDYPFELLVERLQPVRAPSRPPIFQVFFTLHQTPPGGRAGLEAFALGRREGTCWQLGDLEWRPWPLPRRAVPFELSLTAAVDAAGADPSLHLVLDYNSDLFEGTTTERMLGHLVQLLTSLVDDPGGPVSRLAILRVSEREEILAGGHGPATTTEDSWPCLHHLVREQTRRTPEAVAVLTAENDRGAEAGRQKMSYLGLTEAADRLGRRLRSGGVRLETPVALIMDRSPDMMVALLGILEAGGAWVPLDPSWPVERLRGMLEDAWQGQEVRVLVTRRREFEEFRDLEGLATWVVFADVPEDLDSTPFPDEVQPENLAYTIYTSGSTGRPKGVEISHRAVVNFLRSMAEAPGPPPPLQSVDARGTQAQPTGLPSAGTLLAVTTLSFDISVLELFLPLIVGGCLVVASRGVASNAQRLAEVIADHNVSMLQATPATWRLLVESGWRGQPGLVMLCGGEALPADLAADLQQRGAALWNMYGPTETTVWSAVRRVDVGEAPVRIGGPIRKTRLAVLDRHLELVPSGVCGELFISGVGLARGYRGRPALTAERFLPDPFAGDAHEAGGRLYRVGDMARWGAVGILEFFGRVDHQVKVRGHRIELGEIEAVLSEHPAVAQAVVVVREVGSGDVRLEAHWVAEVESLTAEHDHASAAAGRDEGLRQRLAQRLPDYMLPSAFHLHERLPLNPSGKIDRKALSTFRGDGGVPSEEEVVKAPRSELEQMIVELWCEVLEVPAVSRDANFFDLGGHSLLVTRLHRRLVERSGREDLTVVHLFQHSTVRAQAHFLAGLASSAPARRSIQTAETSGEVAIIGLAGRFPGAMNVGELWQILRSGTEAIKVFSDEELADVDPELRNDPRYVRARGVLAEAESFDAAFFGLTPREAEVMDPQHRLFLECAWEALEDAGYNTARDGGRIGLFAGVGMNSYLLHAGEETLAAAAGSYQAFISNDKDFVPTRASYKLNLRGPSVNVQTACSSSLVAVHLACQSLAAGESDMALAGGVTVRVPQHRGYVYEPGAILSPDGHCRAFDARAGGTVLGNGLGLVVLKPLAAARRDGDHVWAVIKGSAINNDGADKIGYTAPSVTGQAGVVAEALEAAGVSADSISYVEAHGTGTALGDPIEVEALRQAFGQAPADPGKGRTRCALGSVKTNLGHLDTAAGIAGLIKTVLMLHHRELVPSLHFEAPNPKLPLAGGPFYVNTQHRAWESEGQPRRAGVSSFGIGGTNAHVVLEEAPPPPAPAASRPHQLLTLSARTPRALERMTDGLAAHLRDQRPALADVAHTLGVGRREFEQRRFLVADDLDDAIVQLEQRDPEKVRSKTAAAPRPVAYLFSGQGSQHLHMGWDLYTAEPVFRREVDRAAEQLWAVLGFDLREVIAPRMAENATVELEQAARRLQQTGCAQPALFVIEYALARLWMSWGVAPAAMVGHSIGEWVAATLAGVFQFDDALRLVAERGRQMQAQPSGAMLAVPLSEAETRRFLSVPEIVLAAINSPQDCVVSGPEPALTSLAERLVGQGIRARRLHTSHAFHSPSMQPAADALEQAVGEVRRAAPQIPFFSNVTGTWITAEEATDPGYWGHQVVAPVRFSEAVATLAGEGHALLEVGPGRALTQLVRSQLRSAGATRKGHAILAVHSLPHPRDPGGAEETILRALGRLWQGGVEVDRAALYRQRDESRGRIPLPTYPFERQRYWLENTHAKERSMPGEQQPTNGLARREEIDTWFYAPVWKQAFAADPPTAEAPGARPWLLVLPPGDGEGRHPLLSALGECFRALGRPLIWQPDPGQRASWTTFFEGLGEVPEQVIYAVGFGASGTGSDGAEEHFTSLLGLMQALALAEQASGERALSVLVPPIRRITGRERLEPAGALLAGLVQVAGQELKGLHCRLLEVEIPTAAPEVEEVAEDLMSELVNSAARPPQSRTHVALRLGSCWVREYEPLGTEALPLEPLPLEPLPLVSGTSVGTSVEDAPLEDEAPRPVWLITGGLGGVGLALARGLCAHSTNAPALALLGRRGLPPRELWDHDECSPWQRQRIAAVRGLEETGAEVLVLAADITTPEALGEALSTLRAQAGPIRGWIHAAGVAGGGMLSQRVPEEALAVLAPKVQGLHHLAAELAEDPLETVILCSSINAVVGGWGQGDYVAANAYLDAWAAAYRTRRGPRVVSLAWDRFRDVGMAAVGAGEGSGAEHPLLGTLLFRSPEQEIYRREFTPSEQWVLREHLVTGRPTVPGATWLEMVRAAWAQGGTVQRVEIRDVAFLEPLAVDPEMRSEVLTVVAPVQGTFRILSRAPGEPTWRLHCQGRATVHAANAGAPSADRLDIEAIRERCPRRLTASEVLARSSQGFLVTGRRWEALTHFATGEDELLADLELPADLAHDLDHLDLHPALLDAAVGCVQFIAEGDFLPLGYELLECIAPLPGRFHSHVRMRPGGEQDLLVCDAQLIDGEGLVCVRVEGFSMRRTTTEAVRAAMGRARPGVVSAEVSPLAAVLEGTISGEQAAEVLHRVLNARQVPSEVIISPRDLSALAESYRDFDPSALAAEFARSGAAFRPAASHPDGAPAWTPPAGGMEGMVAEVWQRFLGVEEIAASDNFFELGGTSLLGVQVVGELSRRLGREVPTVALFEAPTIRALARRLAPEDETVQPFARTRARIVRKKHALQTMSKARRRRAERRSA